MLDQMFDVVAENKKRLETLRRIEAQQGSRMSTPMNAVAAQQGTRMSNIPPEQLALIQNASPNFAAKIEAEKAGKLAPGAKSPDLASQLGTISTALNTSGAGSGSTAGNVVSQSLAGASAGAGIAGLFGAGAGTGAVAAGTKAGAVGGPSGMAVGAGVGAGLMATSAIMGAREERKKRQRDAEARAQENIANIHQSEGVQKNQAISNIIMGLRSAFLGK